MHQFNLHNVNLTVIALGVGAMVGLMLFRRSLWFIVLPPSMSMIVYTLLNVIWKHH
jgi:hypothetical protein